MGKNVFLPVALFLLSAITALISNPVPVFVAGLLICVVAVLKYRAIKAPKEKLGTNSLFRSGLAVLVGPIVVVGFVAAAMSGLFGSN